MIQPTRIPKIQKKQSKPLTFADHFHELRNRILIVLLVFILGTVYGLFTTNDISHILVQPLSQPLFYTSPAGGFEFMIQTSFFLGFICAIPVFTYQCIKFFEPVMPKSNSYIMFGVFFSSILLLCAGIGFAYFVSLPAALHFLNQFATDQVHSLISTKEYFSFVTRYLIGFGLIFQLPLIIVAANAVKKISIQKLLSYQRAIILISFIISSIITPTPDIFNQSLMALPIILLYQIAVAFVWLINTKNQKSEMKNNYYQ